MNDQAVFELQTELLKAQPGSIDALRICSGAGFIPLGLGKSRIALERGADIYKIAWSEAGVADNHIENLVFHTAEPDLKEVLAPVHRVLDGHILIQGRCEPIEYRGACLPVMETLSKHGVVDGLVNLGVYRGRIVCYDYASVSSRLYRKIIHSRPH